MPNARAWRRIGRLARNFWRDTTLSRWSAVARLGPYTVAALIWRAKKRCTWCGQEVAKGRYAIDHVVPRALGGTDVCRNLVLACSECNVARSAAPGISPPLLARIKAAGRTEAECWDEVRRQLEIPVGRGTWANTCSRPLAKQWFGDAITQDLAHARSYKARVAQELKRVPF
ncbi:HNH endonuclease signature motif containing protein [Sorangium sp. So ce1036]|uniref:HNH endonuclease n=1 Tax=Sorangium sp. So ce1036 TaxID=3133328 RepID=UPI003F03A738